MDAVNLHFFTDTNILACSAMAVAIVEHETGVAKGILTTKT